MLNFGDCQCFIELEVVEMIFFFCLEINFLSARSDGCDVTIRGDTMRNVFFLCLITSLSISCASLGDFSVDFEKPKFKASKADKITVKIIKAKSGIRSIIKRSKALATRGKELQTTEAQLRNVEQQLKLRYV